MIKAEISSVESNDETKKTDDKGIYAQINGGKTFRISAIEINKSTILKSDPSPINHAEPAISSVPDEVQHSDSETA